jgi:hypothetical protein
MGSAPYRIDAGVLLFFGGASLARSLSLVGPPFLEIRLCNINVSVLCVRLQVKHTERS